MSLDGKRIMRYLIPVALCFLSVAYTSTIGNCTFDGCQADRYCNQTTGACQLCRNHADDCLTTRQKSECNQVCFKLMLKQSKETERCSALPELKNGSYNGKRVNQSQRYGDEVTITCNTGFHVTGPSKNVCGSYGRWKNQFASCDDIQCAKPPRLMNGYYKERSERYLVRSSVLYGCYSGYRINGPQYQLWTCQENGVWDKNTVPICGKVQLKEKRCELPSQPLHGRHGGTKDSRPGETVEFTCEDGYDLEGDEILTCLNEGVWDNKYPTCNKTVCIQPVELKNGGIIETERSEFPVGTSVHYICNEGYFKIDKDYSVWTCTKKGEWDKARVPTCEKLEHDGCSYTGTILVTVIIVLVFQVIIILLIVIGRKFGLDKKFFQKIRNYNIHGDSFNIHGPNAGVSVQNDDGTSEKTRLSSDEEH